MFQLLITDKASYQVVAADISYSFSLYNAQFFLTQAGTYSAIVRLRQYGGLIETYYKTVDFQSPHYWKDLHDQNGGKYTQVDTKINFDLGYDAILSAGYPSEYFSVD